MCRGCSSSSSHGRALWVTLLVLLATAPAGAGAAAGAPANPYAADAVVARVTEVSPHAATYENPPRVKLEVQEVIQGDPQADRRQAVWAPPPHDVDTGIVTENPRYKAWAATKMKGPDVGSRWILYGTLGVAGSGTERVFHVSSHVAVPFSDEERARAVRAARERAAARRKAAAEAEADRRANARIKALWRLLTSQQELETYTAEADLIVTGRWTSAATHANAIGIQVTSVLQGTVRQLPQKVEGKGKGDPRGPGGGDKADEGEHLLYIDFSAGPALEVLMDRDTEYLLFLSDQGVTFSHVSPCYRRIRSGDGVVILDEQALHAVKDALRRQAGRARDASPGARHRN